LVVSLIHQVDFERKMTEESEALANGSEDAVKG
jgi:hypothetical protein